MKQTRNNRREDGITLLLAVFIISGLILIAITVSALAITSIRNSRAVVLSESAAGSAQSGAEEGVWNIKRDVTSFTQCDPNDPSIADKNSENVSSTYSARSFCESHGPATIDLTGSTPYVFYLFDPVSPNGCGSTDEPNPCPDGGSHPLDLSGMDTSYRFLQVTSNAGQSNVLTTVQRLNGTVLGSQTVAPGGQITINGLDGPTGTGIDNRMQVTVQCNACASTDVSTMTLDTQAGMPTIPTVDSTGCAQHGTGAANSCNAGEVYNRRIEVTVPQ